MRSLCISTTVGCCTLPEYAYFHHENLFQTKIDYGTPYGEIALPINKHYSPKPILLELCVVIFNIEVTDRRNGV